MNAMQTAVSCLPVSLFHEFYDRKLDVLMWSERASQIGLDYIDINIRCLLGMKPEEAEALSKKLSVPIMMITTYSDFTNPDDEMLERAVADAKKDIEMAAALKAKYLRLTAGQAYPGETDETMIRRIYSCFEMCLPVAEAHGVGILLENHSKPGAWQYPDYDFHLERMLKLWNCLQELPVGINFDTANAYALRDWKSLVDAFGSRIETVHINDLETVVPLKFSCVGEGVVPQAEILREVYRRGFHGPICIEDACMRGMDGIETAFNHTKEILQKLGM